MRTYSLILISIFFIRSAAAFDYFNSEATPDSLKISMWEAPSGPFDPKGTYPKGEGEYFWLFGDKGIATFNKLTMVVGRTWKFNDFEQTVLFDEVPFNSDTFSEYNNFRDSGALGMNVYNKKFITDKSVPWVSKDSKIDTEKKLGCLNELPLKFGDFDSVDPGLVAIVGSIIILFSLEFERTIFKYSYFNSDELDVEKNTYISGVGSVDRLSGNYKRLGPNAPQFIAASGTDILIDEIYPAWRSFAKVYSGDFDEDGNLDILMWRKFYKTLELGDSRRGFELNQQGLIHFERDLIAQVESPAGITGEYLPQDTPEADIQKWLAENNLTWSKGDPSKSECPGDEGQWIPEMHDPLLNDPEVLQ
jgi:hypothetical protein